MRKIENFYQKYSFFCARTVLHLICKIEKIRFYTRYFFYKIFGKTYQKKLLDKKEKEELFTYLYKYTQTKRFSFIFIQVFSLVLILQIYFLENEFNVFLILFQFFWFYFYTKSSINDFFNEEKLIAYFKNTEKEIQRHVDAVKILLEEPDKKDAVAELVARKYLKIEHDLKIKAHKHVIN